VVTFPASAHTKHTPRCHCELAIAACREVKTPSFSFTFLKSDRFTCLDITLSEVATTQPRSQPSHKSCAESITGEAANIPVPLRQSRHFWEFLSSDMEKPNVYVVGVGLTKFIKPRNLVDYPELGFEAGVKAMLDAGINYDDVDQGIACYCYGDSTCGQKVFYQFG